jgi:hypothetical protein
MSNGERYLIISDLQIPFEHKDALSFCKYVKKWFQIPDENCYCVGDETDGYYLSKFPKSPDRLHSATSEIQETRDKIALWASEFPILKIAESNHKLRLVRRAVDSYLPQFVLRKYEEIIGSTDGWKWADEWLVKAARRHFTIRHGMEYSGRYAGHQALQLGGGMSTVFGHLHTVGGVTYQRAVGFDAWAMAVGCLIDEKSYAFAYGQYQKMKPALGVGVVLGGGTLPIWIPLNSR